MDDPQHLSAWQTLLNDRLGLYYADHSPVLKKAVHRLCREFELSSEGVIRLLGQCPDHDVRWQRVRDEAVVSSSRFFRDADMFATIEHWLEARDSSRPLSAMSFGSADGREAYSLAMLFAEKGLTFSIVGIDLSPKAIASANKAHFIMRDIDEIPPPWQSRYTRRVNDTMFTLIDEIRECIAFVSPESAQYEGAESVDLICCQNTLMYLTHERQMAHLQWFEEQLNPGGLLILSPTDQPQWRGRCLQRYANPRVRALLKPMEAVA